MSLEFQFRVGTPALPVARGSSSGDTLLEVVSSETAGALNPRASHYKISRPEARTPGFSQHVPVGGRLKRLVDVAASLLLLIALSPMLLLISVAIRVLLKEWPISRQQLLGANGRTFAGFKFRTMPANAEEILRRFLLSDPGAAREWRETHSLRNDPRLGCLGRVLTQAGLDDMPQLFNVLRGDMSLVGPRPVAIEERPFHSTHGVPYRQARPGMTGLWRLDDLGPAVQARHGVLDRYYRRHWSFRLDCWILLKTIPAFLDATQRPG